MLNRFAVIAVVLGIVVALMAVKNRVLVGKQDFYALLRVEAVGGQVTKGTRVFVDLNDLGGREINATENELEHLRALLNREVDPNLPIIPFDAASVAIDEASKRMTFVVTGDVALIDLRHAVGGSGYERQNDPCPFIARPSVSTCAVGWNSAWPCTTTTASGYRPMTIPSAFCATAWMPVASPNHRYPVSPTAMSKW